MTICALLLVERFYKHQPSMKLRYGTLGLLFRKHLGGRNARALRRAAGRHGGGQMELGDG